MSALVLGAVLACGAAQAQTAAAPPPNLAAEAKALIDVLETARDTTSFKLLGQVRGARLADGKNAAFEFAVDPKKPYRVIAMCDDAKCSGVDVWATDGEKKDIAKDLSDDPLGMVDVKPGAAGSKLRALVFMGDCKEAECVAALAVFEVLPQPKPKAP